MEPYEVAINIWIGDAVLPYTAYGSKTLEKLWLLLRAGSRILLSWKMLKCREKERKCLSFGGRFWSRAGPGSISSLEIGIQSIIFYIFTIYDVLPDVKWLNLALITFIWTKIAKCLTSWTLRKLVPDVKGLTWSLISIEFEKNIKNESKSWYAFIRRVYKLHLT